MEPHEQFLRRLLHLRMLICTPRLPGRVVMAWRVLGQFPAMVRLGLRVALWNRQGVRRTTSDLLADPLFRDDAMKILRQMYKEWDEEQIEYWAKQFDGDRA